jgi:hypothetical protein
MLQYKAMPVFHIAMLTTGILWIYLLTACQSDAQKKNKQANDATPKINAQTDFDNDSSTLEVEQFINDSMVLAKTDTIFSEFEEGFFWMGQEEEDTANGRKDGPQHARANADPAREFMQEVSNEPIPLNLEEEVERIKIPETWLKEVGPAKVQIKLLINRNGKPKDFFVYKSPDLRITKAILYRLRNLRYRPAVLDGKPVKAWVNFTYQLKSA